MAKRVKKGLWHRDEVDAYEKNGKLYLEQLRSNERHTIILSPSECEALGMTAVLEDVPQEPWERLRDALALAWREMRGADVGPFPDLRLPTDDPRAVLERALELLGIKPEGDS